MDFLLAWLPLLLVQEAPKPQQAEPPEFTSLVPS